MTFDEIYAWIVENWAAIVAFVDKFYKAIKGVINGDAE